MKLPTQTVVTAKAQADIVTCINCSRILFWTRDMDH
jgi:predicted  nucleic acid-binding Zn-ribbon protein